MDGIVDHFRRQAYGCGRMGSPLYEQLITAAADDLAEGGAVAAIVGDWPGEPTSDALALRFAGAVHYLVLTGSIPELAAHYPSTGGRSDATTATIFLDAVRAHDSSIRDRMWVQQVQTNEVGRSAVLLGGYLMLAAEFGLPLEVLEIGTAAGLNLLFDRYRYDLGEVAWGEPDSPVLVTSVWRDRPPPLTAPLEVTRRAGSDLTPIDVADPEQATSLLAFIWPDQEARWARARNAIDLAAAAGLDLSAMRASEWLEHELAGRPHNGSTRVVAHSFMWHYMPEEEQAKCADVIEQAGAAATSQSPFAHVSLEHWGEKHSELHLQTWPGDERRVLAHAQAHGAWVNWKLS